VATPTMQSVDTSLTELSPTKRVITCAETGYLDKKGKGNLHKTTVEASDEKISKTEKCNIKACKIPTLKKKKNQMK
jgi:hypothetical protein